MSFLEQYDAADESTRAEMAMGWVFDSTHDFFAELRRDRPILVTPGGPTIVTRYSDVQEVLSRETVFSVRDYVPMIEGCVGPFMLSRDATVYNDRDKSIMRAMLRYEDLPHVAAICKRLADDAVAAAGGSLDIVPGLTRHVPVGLCGEYFGFPGPDAATMMRWSRSANLDMFANPTGDADAHQANLDVGAEMREHVDSLIAQRRADGQLGDDILGRLLAARLPESIGFDDARIRTNIMFMLIGGVETVSGAAVLIIDELLRRPDELAGAAAAAVAGDDELLGQYCWEALRLNPIFAGLLRHCETDYTVASGTERETRIPAGTTVLAAIGSAGLDGKEVPDPEEFVLGRPHHHLNMHFGYGHHLCLAYYISLVEVPAIVGAVLKQPGLRRADGAAGQVDTHGGPFPESFTLVW